MSELLEQIGLTQEELQNRTVQHLASHFLSGYDCDEDGMPVGVPTEFSRRVEQLVTDTIDAKVGAMFEEHILPNVEKLVEGAEFQETNRWGEKKKEPLTFKEYLVHRAEKWLTEKVDHDGKGEKESYGGKLQQTRLTFMVHRHLQYSIENAIKSAIANANKQLAGGIEETCKIKLKEISEALQVSVQPKR